MTPLMSSAGRACTTARSRQVTRSVSSGLVGSKTHWVGIATTPQPSSRRSTMSWGEPTMFVEAPVIQGHCHVEVFGPDGELKHEREVDNLIVSAGRDAIIERLDSAPTTAATSHMALGTGAVAP